jgi:rhamnulokinase
MRVFAGVDLGAESGRVAVGRFDGEHLAVEEVHRFANVPVRVGGSLTWDAPRLRDEVFAGLAKTAQLGPVEAVAVDAWAVDFGLIDAAGALIRNPIHYRDGRRAAAYDRVLELIPPSELYRRTGIQLLPINTIFELAAMARDADAALHGADRLLLIPDLFHFWLCGSRTTEFTNATTTQCYDAAAGTWADDLLARLGIPSTVMPEVVVPATVLGPVGETLPALENASVIATATHDTGAAVAAIPMQSDRCAYLSIGTWSLVGIESATPIVSDAAFAANLTNEGGLGGTFRVLRNITGLWLLEECRRAWQANGRSYTYEELIEAARSAQPFVSLIDPDDASFSEPGDMPARIARHCAETGQDEPASIGATARCILESLALKQAQVVELLSAVTGREIDQLHVVGGGANNELLCSMTASATGRPLLAGPAEATTIGNLIGQAIALNELSSLEQGRDLVRRSFKPVEYEPSGDTLWEQARHRFQTLTSAKTEVGAFN